LPESNKRKRDTDDENVEDGSEKEDQEQDQDQDYPLSASGSEDEQEPAYVGPQPTARGTGTGTGTRGRRGRGAGAGGTRAGTRRKKVDDEDGEDTNIGARLAKEAKISDDNALFSKIFHFNQTIHLFNHVYCSNANPCSFVLNCFQI
jgi:hypothetical protein